MYTNFVKQYLAKARRDLFWKTTRATNKEDIWLAMAEINAIDVIAHQQLLDNDPIIWACHKFNPFFKADHVTIEAYL